jgi:hypothetical protein
MRRTAALVLLASLLSVTTSIQADAAQAANPTISPLGGTRDASPRTQISFLGVPAQEIHDIAVVGSRTGRHEGRFEAYESAQGASFMPSKPFQEGERVTVSAMIGAAARPVHVSSSFSVALHAPYSFKASASASSTGAPPKTTQAFISEPSIYPTTVAVTAHSTRAAPGDVFFTFDHGYGENGAMITDGSGSLVWFKPVPKGDIAMDLQLQSYEGKQALVWWQGGITKLGIGFGVDEVYDASYRRVAEVRAGNGYWADLHDVQITPQGSAFVTAYTLVRADLSLAGGSREGSLQDALVQEVDVKTGLVMFEWHALGHVALGDSFTHYTSPGNPWDWFHLNSVSLGPQGDLLLSARNTWCVYDVSLANGGVLWRLGGKKSSFHMGSGTGTAWQHDARFQPDGTITIFDDGAAPKEHSQSRVIREQLDPAHRSVKLLDRYVHTPSLLSGSQGNDQVLPNGDSFVGWGSEPYFTEYSPTGQVLFDGHLQSPAQSYRAYKFPWNATPYYPPAITVRTTNGKATVYASWNGATNVTQWRVLAGNDPTHLTTITTTPKTSFETTIPTTTNAPAYAIQALDPTGNTLATSPTVSAHG